MNIEDRAGLYASIARVLKPRAPFGVYDIFQGDGGPVCYPVPWAIDETTSFLVGLNDFPALLEDAGFDIVSVRDTTAPALNWFEKVQKRLAGHDPDLADGVMRGAGGDLDVVDLNVDKPARQEHQILDGLILGCQNSFGIGIAPFGNPQQDAQFVRRQ